jgi:hypothetical protein
LAEKAFRSDAKAVPKIVGEVLKLVAAKFRLADPFSQCWDFPIGTQKQAGSVGPSR